MSNIPKPDKAKEIHTVKESLSDNPVKQIWKFLRNFLDVSFTTERIRQYQKIPEGTEIRLVKKQALQIGYCIRQAEEYFRASAQVGLATRPTLLYYGAASLSYALVLLKRDGNYSFDALRKTAGHKHHGLDLVGKPHFETGQGPTGFLQTVQCRLHMNENVAWGQFALFYSSLISDAFILETRIVDAGNTLILNSKIPYPGSTVPPIEILYPLTFNVFDLMRNLSDLAFSLVELGIRLGLCAGSSRLDMMKRGEGEFLQHVYNFFIDGIMEDDKAHLISLIQKNNPNMVIAGDVGRHVHLRLAIPGDPSFNFYMPDVVEDINGKQFSILKPENYIPELSMFMIILYCLSMVSRYYPDVWMKVIDNSVQTAELIDTFLNAAYRKVPNLILDQMTLVKHHIHL